MSDLQEFLHSDLSQMKRIRAFLAENRADLDLDAALEIHFHLGVKFTGYDETGKWKRFEPLDIGAALITFADDTAYEIVYIPLSPYVPTQISGD